MSRRRPTLAAYLHRRWRSVGAILVLLLGALLVLAVTDRGHDPVWKAGVGDLDAFALAPDGSVVYALLREGENVSALQARAGEGGELLWESDLDATRAILAAGERGVAVATDFPLAFLTVYNADGSPRWQVPLQGGSPVAMKMQEDRLALALNAPGNPVLVWEGSAPPRTLRLPQPVRALDLEGDLVATGGLSGAIVVYRGAEEIVNVSLPMAVRSLRLAEDGTALFAGGASLAQEDPRGRVAFVDVGAKEPVRWTQDTRVGVGLVDVDAAALRVLAVEEDPPTATLHVFEGATGATKWTRVLEGTVARDDAGDAGGAGLSPDGDAVAVATLRGDLHVFDAASGELRWAYRAGGATQAAFPSDEPRRLIVGARLLESSPTDSILLFLTPGEPVGMRAPLVAVAIVGAACFTLALIIGLGFWRARRSY